MSRPFTVALLALVGVGCQSGAADAPQAPTSALRQVQTVDLPGVEGRFDHFAADDPTFESRSLDVIDSVLAKAVDRGAVERSIRRTARLMMTYEAMYWDTLYGASMNAGDLRQARG